ncbi:MAG: hypothetical protein V1844_09900 [Pseudomonadota bacterium]
MADMQIITPPGIITVNGRAKIVTITIREHIISAFEAAMAVVTLANGYHSDAGANIIRARKNLDPSELPCIVIWPGMETGIIEEYGVQKCSMRLGVEAHALFGTENPSVTSEWILGDLIKAVFSQTVTALADEIQYESGGTDSYPDAGEIAIGVKLNLVIKYHYLIGNPYSQ